MTVEEAVSQALRNNPAVASLRLHDEGLKLEDSAVLASRLPVLSTIGEVGWNVATPISSSGGFTSQSITYMAGFELKIPIFDGHRRELAHASLLAERRLQESRQRDLRRS